MLCKVVWEIMVCCKLNWENELGFSFSCFFSVPRIGINTQQQQQKKLLSLWLLDIFEIHGEFMISPYSWSSE